MAQAKADEQTAKADAAEQTAKADAAEQTAKADAEQQTVKVQLKCIYSGATVSWSPGDVIEVDAEEAARLIGLGAAETV